MENSINDELYFLSDLSNINPDEIHDIVKSNDSLRKKVFMNFNITPSIKFTTCNLITILAKYKEHNKTTKFLIAEHNISAENTENWTLLMIASLFENIELYKFLIERNDDLDLQDKTGMSALIRCLYQGTSFETVKLLVDAGANLNLQDRDKRTALIIIFTNLSSVNAKYRFKIARLLIYAGADVNLQDDLGNTVLILASKHSYVEGIDEIIKLLIRAGANLDLQDKFGSTGLMLLSTRAGIATVNEQIKTFLEAGANPNLQNNGGWTALMILSGLSVEKKNQIEPIKMIIKAGTNLNLQNNEKNTALMFAVRNSIEIIKLLVDEGADLYLKNIDGKTAFQLCDLGTQKFLSLFVMLKVWKIRELSRNKMNEAFSVYNITGNVFLFLKPK